jgi:NAD(P)-dependent dehydrogenase (short-subunit alcohol dehydrogenase family)
MAATAMEGKVAVVTGGGSGLGEACVHALASRGATVAVADISKEAAERVAGEIGGRATAIPADVADEHGVRSMIERTVADHGRLDIAVNNAGIGGDQLPTGEYPVESWRKVLSVNLDGVFYCMLHELPAMLANGAAPSSTWPRSSARSGSPSPAPTSRPSTAWSGGGWGTAVASPASGVARLRRPAAAGSVPQPGVGCLSACARSSRNSSRPGCHAESGAGSLMLVGRRRLSHGGTSG